MYIALIIGLIQRFISQIVTKYVTPRRGRTLWYTNPEKSGVFF